MISEPHREFPFSDATYWQRVVAPMPQSTPVAPERLAPIGKAIAEGPVMLTLLIVLLLLALLGGGLGYGRFGAAGLSPAAIVIVILLILAATGRL